MPENYQKEWLDKARIDYFPPFVSLWLAFNAWYRAHYAEFSAKNDRVVINHIKQDATLRNMLLTNVKRLLEGDKKDSKRFKSALEQFHEALEEARISYYAIPDKYLSLACALIHAESKNDAEKYANLLRGTHIKDKIRLDGLHITNDASLVMAGTLELVYQVRCLLFHGNLAPREENHEVVKYAYLTLYDMMR